MGKYLTKSLADGVDDQSSTRGERNQSVFRHTKFRHCASSLFNDLDNTHLTQWTDTSKFNRKLILNIIRVVFG